MFLNVCKQTFRKLYGYITREFFGLRMRSFQGIWTQTYSEIFKSALVYLASRSLLGINIDQVGIFLPFSSIWMLNHLLIYLNKNPTIRLYGNFLIFVELGKEKFVFWLDPMYLPFAIRPHFVKVFLVTYLNSCSHKISINDRSHRFVFSVYLGGLTELQI